MAVTISNLNSRVNLVDGNNTLSEPVMEQIVREVVTRVRSQMESEAQARQEREITNRSTTPEPF
ncbi:MAG: hypothetical protein VKN72_07420 [Nostocales cyanobacterium 94392]|nr:hypothetical protein [Nostocales cyanobacterium 94392]